ncbi:MAG: tRNA dihydrouridine synthase DusB [Limnobacter sp.]|uniref:tRNA dihydrouridine synthase DusB n=1 Tax=Limnobacter sp. TaxID=2003368 RepID=UPI00391BFB43
MQLAQFTLPNNLFLAPMAGVTDRPFRQLCKKLGAGHAVSEMAASNPKLWATDKSTRRLNHEGETKPVAVQIAGSDPAMMAHAAAFNIERGAQIIDINMGCPAKKVCAVAAGSALLQNEPLVESILRAVHHECASRGVPLTLKYRTGWAPDQRNALTIAHMAQDIGISLLTLHGRTRACGYTGDAEYDTIRAVKAAVSIPVIANGDVTSPEKAKFVLDYTGADGVMIGRAAQGNPWIFRETLHFLNTGKHLAPPTVDEAHSVMLAHLADHHQFYGEKTGLRTARKHLQWYLCGPAGKSHPVIDQLMLAESTVDQLRIVDSFFNALVRDGQRYFAAPDSTTHYEPTDRRLAA